MKVPNLIINGAGEGTGCENFRRIIEYAKILYRRGAGEGTESWYYLHAMF